MDSSTKSGTSAAGRQEHRLSRWLPSREKLIACLAVTGLLLAGCFFGVRALEWHVTFHPSRYSDAAAKEWRLPEGTTSVWLQTADHVRLNAWFFKSDKPSQGTLIFFHGNAGNISDVAWYGERLRDRGFDVFLVDYRGFGRSEGESTGEQSIYADAEAAYQYVHRTLGVAPEKIALYGQSLGTTAVIDLASRHRCGAIIIESGLSSADDLAVEILPAMISPLRLLAKNRFDSVRKLGQVSCPVLITHGEPDPIIPTAQAKRLFAAANEPRTLKLFPGAGHNVYGTQGNAYLNLLVDFLRLSLKTKPTNRLP